MSQHRIYFCLYMVRKNKKILLDPFSCPFLSIAIIIDVSMIFQMNLTFLFLKYLRAPGIFISGGLPVQFLHRSNLLLYRSFLR